MVTKPDDAREKGILQAKESLDDQPADLGWLPKLLRPSGSITIREQRAFLISGFGILYAGYDLSIYGLAMPQIQASLAIPEDQLGITISFFRLAAIVAIAVCACADVIGRRRLFLFAIFGQALGTLATAFVANYSQLVAIQIFSRICGFSEEMLCLVIICEEISARERGWANGMLSALYSAGAALASLIFAAITILPFGWRSIFLFGGIQLSVLAYFRRSLRETKRFELGRAEIQHLRSNAVAVLDLTRKLVSDHPRRLFTLFLAVAALGFAIAPASALAYKYMQQSLGFSPVQTTMLFVPCAALAAVLNIAVGRLSDRSGRRLVMVSMCALSAISYAIFYSGFGGWPIALGWVVGYLAYLAADALCSGFAVEIVPTAYRATVSAIRLAVQILAGALSLALEGWLYHRFGGHGPAISLFLLAMPITLVALILLPEPAGKPLETLSEADRESNLSQCEEQGAATRPSGGL
jgi:MFS family permease